MSIAKRIEKNNITLVLDLMIYLDHKLATHLTASRRCSNAISKFPLRYSISPASIASPILNRDGAPSAATMKSTRTPSHEFMWDGMRETTPKTTVVVTRSWFWMTEVSEDLSTTTY